MYQDTGKKTISRQPICLTDYDCGYILEENGHREKIDFERDVDVYSENMILLHLLNGHKTGQ